MDNEKKYHTFSLAYMHYDGNKQTVANCVAFREEKKLTDRCIQTCKQELCVDKYSVMMSCSYLGYMTKVEFFDGCC